MTTASAITSVDRSVAENTAAGADVGDVAVTAMDDDDTVLTYSLGGRDERSFGIDPATGQIEVGNGTTLDFETRTTYTVIVRARDAQNLTDTVTVNITVTDEEEDPEITAGPMTVEYAENRADAVATYTATDPEDDSASPRKPLTWTLTGSDAADFTIDGGMLKFKTPPDFENDQGLGNGNNVYDVVVMVTDSATGTTSATRSVMVTVTNVEEAGTVTLSAEQPQEEIALTATLSDPDESVTGEMWQWARSRNGSSGWTDIEVDTETDNPNANVYTPVNGDVGYYLRATVTYKDGESAADVQENDKTAEVVSTRPVRKTPYENAAPVFQDDEGKEIPTDSCVERSVAENSRAGTAVGDPVAATDPGDVRPDVLTYTLDDGTDAALFDIDSGTGQIKVKAGENLNHESMETYTVTVTATDPSHVPNDDQNNFSDSITVTIMVTDVDEFPAFTEGDTEVDYEEKGTDAVDTYPATDPEDDIASPQKPRKWSLSGIDGSKFAISDAGALTFVTPPDYEAPADSGRNNVYNVTVEATDSSGNTSARAVTVTVDNIEEAGTVTLSNLQPEDGVEITATLTDPDGSVSGLTWQWAKNNSNSGTPDSQDNIDGAMSSTYRPVSGDVLDWLWAIASYTDGQGASKTTSMVSGYVVQAADTTNEPPKFPDQDDQTEGDQTDQTRTVAENTAAGQPVMGLAVEATDEDDAMRLTYTLGGDDQNSFAIDRKTGQITVGEGTVLNFESKDTYVVMVTATDATGDSATVKVTITVTGVDEPPELSKKALVVVGDERVDYLENGTDTVETYTAAGPDSVGARWSLSGADASRFALSNGVLSFRSSPNFESPTDSDSDNVYNVIVQASKGSLQDARTVTIKVINLDEKGAIRLSSQQPDVGIELGATLTDPDGGVTGERWQWAWSPDGATRWSDIPAASSATYTPVLADAANFLRVTVGYEDAQGGGKSASAETSGATGVDNDGVVTLSSSTPQVGVELTASLRDPDGGVTGEAWQWARSQDGATNWEDIGTAASNAYTPVAADEDNYLRATVSYTDGDGPGKSANEISANAVAVVAVIENTAPEFPASETGARSVPENALPRARTSAPRWRPRTPPATP